MKRAGSAGAGADLDGQAVLARALSPGSDEPLAAFDVRRAVCGKRGEPCRG